MNEQELRAEFERECLLEHPDISSCFMFERQDSGEYSEPEAYFAYPVWKRAKLQSEQRIAELESELQRAYDSIDNVVFDLTGNDGDDTGLTVLEHLSADLEGQTVYDVVEKYEELKAENERLKAAQIWQPIETAPKDGGPVWVRGTNYGDQSKGLHACWGWFDGDDWRSVDFSENGQSKLMYLTGWMPQPQRGGCWK